MKAFKALFKTELKISLRGMDMPIFSIVMPLIVLVVIGLIYHDQPLDSTTEITFFEMSFGAISTIAIAAGGVMGLPMVISDYRSKRILKRYQVTPINPMMLLCVEVLIYLLYAVISLILILLTSIIFFDLSVSGYLFNFLLGWLFVCLTIFSIGVLVGGVSKNTKVAGLIATALYFPMLIFSGATIPYEVMPKAMQRVADVMPLTQGIKILKSAIVGEPIDHIFLPIGIMLGISMICLYGAIKYFKWD